MGAGDLFWALMCSGGIQHTSVETHLLPVETDLHNHQRGSPLCAGCISTVSSYAPVQRLLYRKATPPSSFIALRLLLFSATCMARLGGAASEAISVRQRFAT